MPPLLTYKDYPELKEVIETLVRATSRGDFSKTLWYSKNFDS